MNLLIIHSKSTFIPHDFELVLYARPLLHMHRELTQMNGELHSKLELQVEKYGNFGVVV